MNFSPDTKRLALLAFIGFVFFAGLNWFPPFVSDEQPGANAAAAVTKKEAADKAADFLRERFGARLAGGAGTAFVMFDAFADESGYLLKERLYGDYEREWRKFVPIDHFRVEVADPETGAVYAVLIDMADGRVFGFDTLKSGLAFPATGKTDPAQAAEAGSESAPRTAAEEAAVASVFAGLGYDAERFEADENSAKERRFVHAVRIGEASLAVRVKLNGDRVTGFMPEIRLPEAYAAWKEDQDERGAVYGIYGLLTWLALALAAAAVMVVRRREMEFGRGLLPALVFLIPYAIHNVNLYPGIRLSYADVPEAAGFGILFSQFITMLMAVSVYLCLVAGEGLWRGMGHRLWPRFGGPEYGGEMMKGMARGYLLAFIVLGAQSLLFFAGGKLFGVWSTSDPLESPYNLLEPGLYPLLSWSAAISEEAVFRMFAFALFSVLLRPLARLAYRWSGRAILNNPLCYLVPAALLSGALWALGHAGYAVYPVATRLVEVTVLGLIFAWAFLRYGFFAALFAHASVDIIIMALQIMAMDGKYAAFGIAYMAMPLAAASLFSFAARLKRRPLPDPR